MATITWLHLSDLHFRADARQKWDEDIVLRALLKDVREQRAKGLAPDLILVSGDLAYSGKAEEYALAAAFFDDLLRATGLPKDRLLVVPGNHDVERARISFMARQLALTVADRDVANGLLADPDARRTFLARFEGYASFVNEYLGHIPFDADVYFYVHPVNLPGCPLAVLGLNSAWLAQGGAEDRHRLALGERQVRAALEMDIAQKADLRVALLHHPFHWLQDFDQAECEALLSRACDFILHGHLHQAGLLQARTPDSQAFFVAAGACYETRQQPNAYNYVRLDPASGQGTVYLRAYSDRSGGFWTRDTLNYRNVPDGEYHFSLRDRPAAWPGMPAPAAVAATAESLARARQRYLVQLRRACNALPLAALGGEESADEDITLDRVYVALDTRTPVPLSEEEKEKRQAGFALAGEREDARPLAALEAAVQARRLVLLGDPGSGKSTFVRQLLAWLAAHQLGEGEAPPLAADLLPVLITLRDLAARLDVPDLDALPADDRRAVLARLVRDQALADLERLDAAAFAQGLDKILHAGNCLLAFDGLDEVPPVLRHRVRAAIQAAMGQYALRRVIVTCRVRSYSGEALLPNFEAHTLAPFGPDQVRAFVAAWYAAQQALGRVDAIQARDKTADLHRTALAAELRELSANPMLLTTMAIIHQKEIGLPRERVRLYNLAVEVLLSRWQRRKAGTSDGSLAPDLAALLADDRKLRQVMERLAYEAHSARRGRDGAADLARGQALTLLEAPAYLGDTGLASRFLDYIDRRAGLLVGLGGAEGQPGTYSFPHRTFQEYLAGCYVIGQRDVDRELWLRVRDGDYWQLAVQLGAEELLYNRRGDYSLLDLAYRLCPGSEPDRDHTWRAHLWSGQMAALLGRALIEADCDKPDCGPDYVRRLLRRLVELLEGNHLNAHERAAAGRSLASLGDPRPGIGLVLSAGEGLEGKTGLPDLVWCEVPAGPFLMGEGDKQHKPNISYAYWIARYPVTNAQFGAFVAAGGYGERRYWREAEKAGRWRDGQVTMYDRVPRDRPVDRGEPFNLPNHPVVNVSWYETLAFCRWLGERLKEAGWRVKIWRDDQPLAGQTLDPGPWQVRLPTEAEWEKAARGTDGREFPWGNEADPSRANYYQTGIGTTSAVGCFPGGAGPYGVLDASGNVWEWCQSLYKEYPYSPKDGREKLDNNGDRVLRGGAFYDFERFARCACRYYDSPGYWDFSVGFRLVVAPGPL